jgi:hypothetical protein
MASILERERMDTGVRPADASAAAVCGLLLQHLQTSYAAATTRDVAALVMAAGHGLTLVLQQLLQLHIYKPEHAAHALCAGAAGGHTDACALLVGRADPAARLPRSPDGEIQRLIASFGGCSSGGPFMSAAYNMHEEVIRLLLASSGGAWADAAKLARALNIAAQHGSIELCELLLASGGGNRAGPAELVPVLRTAAELGRTELCQLLLASGGGNWAGPAERRACLPHHRRAPGPGVFCAWAPTARPAATAVRPQAG